MKFYDAISKSQSNVILAGDLGIQIFSNLYDKNNNFIGVEVGALAISSPSFGDTFGEQTKIVEQAFVEENDEIIMGYFPNTKFIHA